MDLLKVFSAGRHSGTSVPGHARSCRSDPRLDPISLSTYLFVSLPTRRDPKPSLLPGDRHRIPRCSFLQRFSFKGGLSSSYAPFQRLCAMRAQGTHSFLLLLFFCLSPLSWMRNEFRCFLAIPPCLFSRPCAPAPFFSLLFFFFFEIFPYRLFPLHAASPPARLASPCPFDLWHISDDGQCTLPQDFLVHRPILNFFCILFN